MKWFFSEIKEMYEDSIWLGVLFSFISLMLISLLFILLFLIGSMVTGCINRFDTGIVVKDDIGNVIEFHPEHNESIPYTTYVGKIPITNYMNEHIPNTWTFEVKDIKSNKIETWETTDEYKIKNIHEGDTLNINNFNRWYR